MKTLLRLAASLAFGAVAGWYLLVGLCNLPKLVYSVACGHNGAMWLPLFVPLAAWVCWMALGTLRVFRGVRQDDKSNGSA